MLFRSLKLNLKNIVLFKIGCSCLTLISTCWNWKRMRRSSSIDIKISTCQGRVHGSWGISRGEKQLLTCSMYEEQTRWRRWRFSVKFDFYVGITIIVGTNKKVEFFLWTGEVQTVIWITKCINTFWLQNLLICFRKQTEIFCNTLY